MTHSRLPFPSVLLFAPCCLYAQALSPLPVNYQVTRVSGVAINNFGQVLSANQVWTPLTPNGTVGQVVDLGIRTGSYCGPYTCTARGINDRGQVVGTTGTNAQAFAFLWSPDTPNGITGSVSAFLGNSWDPSFATAINNSGEIVGGSGGVAFLWADGSAYSDARFGGLLNDFGQTVTNYPATLFSPSASGGTAGVFTPIDGLPGGSGTYIIAINKAGVILGETCFTGVTGDCNRGFLWTPATPNGSTGSVAALPLPDPYTASEPKGLNARGDVVGMMGATPFLYAGGVLYDLSSLGSFGRPVAINDYGQILFETALATPGITPPQPTPDAGPVTIASNVKAAFTVTGAGCQPGGYYSPQTLYWAAGVSCTIDFFSPQSTAVGSRLVFRNWEDGATTNPRTIVASGQEATHTATLALQYLVTVTANPPQGGTVTGGGWYQNSTTAVVTATPAAGYQIGDWSPAIVTPGSSSGSVLLTGPQNIGVNFETLSALPGNYQLSVIASNFFGGLSVNGINSAGQVIGFNPNPFLWSAGTTTILQLPNRAGPVAINDSREMVVEVAGQDAFGEISFSQLYVLPPGGSLTSILPSTRGPTSVAGINNYGQVAGMQSSMPGLDVITGSPFLWTPSSQGGTTGTVNNDSRLNGIVAINDFGQAVMNKPPTLFTPSVANGSDGVFTPVTGIGNFAQLVGINRSGTIVGVNSGHAFLWTPSSPNGTTGVVTEILPMPGFNTMAPAGINASGQVVGVMSRANNTETPFLYAGGIVYDLGLLNVELRQMRPRAINDRGQIILNGFESAFLLSPETTQAPVALAGSPASGSGTSQTFTFTFTDARGWQDLDVLNILIHSALDGRGACYLAYTVSSQSLDLVTDSGSGLLQPGMLSNGQCSISARGVAVSTAGTALTLTIPVAFSASFAGNQIVYAAARDREGGNSDWQAVGTWNVPGAPVPVLSVSATAPAVGPLAQGYTLTFADSNGSNDIAIGNVLINNVLDGRNACYFAFVPATRSLLLVDDAGDAGGPFQSSGSINSQCAVNVSSVEPFGNSIVVKLGIQFSPNFAGNKVVYAATRSKTASSGWQALGTLSIP